MLFNKLKEITLIPNKNISGFKVNVGTPLSEGFIV
jgi:hypothetical protein